MVLKNHPYLDYKVRLVKVTPIPGTDIRVEEYVTAPSPEFRFFRIVTTRKLTQKLPKKLRGHGIWWLDVRSGQFIEDGDLLTSTPITRREYEQRMTKGLKGFQVANERLTAILDRYSDLPDNFDHSANDFFIKVKRI